MSYQLKREMIADGVHFNTIADPKFKHNRLSVNFIIALDKENVTDSVVVPYILKQGFEGCKTFKELSRKLDSLYGASLSCDISKFASNHILSLSIVGLDDRYAIDGEDLTAEYAHLLSNAVFSPNLKDGAFNEKVTKLEKENIIDTIESEINDKRTYAVGKCIETMFAGDAVAIKKYGYKEYAKKITPESAAKAFEEILKYATVEIMFTGCGNSQSAKEVFSSNFKKAKREPKEIRRIDFKEARDTVEEVCEEMDVAQGKLVLGFKTGAAPKSVEERRALKVMCAMYGGTPVSLLFRNVREKMSLCYYCAARYNEATGIVLVDSGVEMHNKEKAYKEILNQLEMIKKGEFTDTDLLHTKLILSTALKSTTDSLWSTENWYLSQILLGTSVSPKEELELYNAVTREQIIQASKCVKLDSVYFLKGKVSE